eukprot:XP_011670877.1 PREDICTED: neuronal calcium sensor 1-like [Strongylocentrotus purpuratus]
MGNRKRQYHSTSADNKWARAGLLTMGKQTSKLAKTNLDNLAETTHFSEKEIRQWHEGFTRDCPNGTLNRQVFFLPFSYLSHEGFTRDCPNGTLNRQHFYDFEDKSFLPEGSVSKVLGLQTVKQKNPERTRIEFEEFIQASICTSQEKPFDEKLNWAFRLYDLDGDGTITRREMLSIVEAIYQMVGNMVQLPEDENTPEKRVDKIFALMDKNRDNQISKEEFLDGSRKDPSIVQALSLYDGLVVSKSRTLPSFCHPGLSPWYRVDKKYDPTGKQHIFEVRTSRSTWRFLADSQTVMDLWVFYLQIQANLRTDFPGMYKQCLTTQ